VAKYAKLIVPSQKDSTTFKRYLCAQGKKHDMLKIRLQASLVSRQEHVPEKHRTNQNQANKTQNSHLKHCISWALGGLTTSFYTVNDSRSSFPSHFNVMKIVPLHEPAKPTCNCTKSFNRIITLLTDPYKQNKPWLEPKACLLAHGINSAPLSNHSTFSPHVL
jgi:hypothetical protein